MASNLNVNVTADATQLRAQLAMAQADLRAYGAEVKKTADELREADGAWAQGITQLDQASAKYNQAKASVQQLSEALAGNSRAAHDVSGAMQETTAAMHNNGAASEAMVLVHEAMSGRFTRMGSSLMILTQRMGGASMAMMALAGAFGVAAMGAMHLIEWLDKVSAAKLGAEARGLGSGLDTKVIDDEVMALRKLGDVTTEQAQRVVGAFVSMRGIEGPVLHQLDADIYNLSLRMGEDVVAASNKVREAWNGNAKAGAELLAQTRASGAAVQAFTTAAENGKPLEYRRILLEQIARASFEVATQTRAANRSLAEELTLGAAAAQMAEAGVPTKPPGGQRSISEELTASADRLKAALAAVNGEMESPVPEAWSQRMSDALERQRLQAAQSGREQGQNWQQIHERMAEVSVNFWKNQVAQTTEGTKNREEAERHLLQAEEQLEMQRVRISERGAKQSYEATVASYDQQIMAARQNFSEVIALENQKLEFIRKAKGDTSREYSDAVKSQDETLARSMQEQIRQVDQAERTKLEMMRATLDEQVAMHQITKAEEIQQIQQGVEAQRQAELQALDDMISMLAEGTGARAKALQMRLALEQKFEADLAKVHAQEVRDAEQAADRIAKDYLSAFSSVESAGKRAFSDLLMGTTTWAKATGTILKSVLEGFIDLGLKVVGNWLATQLAMNVITGAQSKVRTAIESGQSGMGALTQYIVGQWTAKEAAQTGATAAGAAARATIEAGASAATMAVKTAEKATMIGTDAAEAAAGAYKAVVGIPVVGPILAPIAAGVAFAAVSAFGSHAEGAWEIPTDHIAQIHAGEMIIPQRFASAIRDGRAGGLTGGHTVNVNVAINAIDAASFHGAVKAHAHTIARAVSDTFRSNPALRPSY